MTNHWIDIRNSDRIMIIGSNAAENHPISFKWVTEAKERGAKLISVDPRFTRTSSKADIYAPMRSGADIAFIGGMIRYVLNDMQTLTPANRAKKYNMTYVAEYTNAALIINDDFEDTDDTSHPGLFVGYTQNTGDAPSTLGSYAKTNWGYSNTTDPQSSAALVDNTWTAWTDLDEKCVLRLLWNHFSRYTLEKVSQVTGCPQVTMEEVYSTYAESGAPGKAGTIMYAMGTTQHTHGTQNIRAYAILQLLLGNVGVAGGGINALRGTSNVQGSTDMCLLEHILPGYLSMIKHTDVDLNAYIDRAESGKSIVTPNGLAGDRSASWWWYDTTDPYVSGADNSNYRKYIVSLLKAWYGDNATSDDAFSYLPKKNGSGPNYTHIGMFEAISTGVIKGLMCFGQNPAVGGPDSEGERNALEKLEWLVVADLFETETSSFWSRPGANTANIATEVYLLPAACSYEKQGSISNSGRWAQWRYKAVDPVGESKPDLAMLDEIVLKLKELYEADAAAPNRDAITRLHWGYRTSGEYEHEADPNVVAKEINGYTWSTGTVLTSFGGLKTDGTTCSGNWLYCGMFDSSGNNKAKNRDTVDTSLNQIGLYSGWAWCWPLNRRIIYNRASVDLDGNPWDNSHPVIAYDATYGWQGDVPDGGWAPINIAAPGSKYLPFIMHREGVGHIWGPGRAEGPLPEVYEPWESPLDVNLITGVGNDASYKGKPGFNNPCCYVGYLGGDNGKGINTDYPCVGITYRLTEHWQAGQMTRNHPWLIELQPQPIAELGVELAADRSIQNGDMVRVSTARGSVDCIAVVTPRLRRLTIGEGASQKTIDHVGVPWHWGYVGLSTGISPNGSSGNVLTPHVGDANTTIPEYKTFLCQIQRV